jgi:hypothetical protein
MCHLSYAHKEMYRRLTKSKFFIGVRSHVAAGYPLGTYFGNKRFYFAINRINEEQAAF